MYTAPDFVKISFDQTNTFGSGGCEPYYTSNRDSYGIEDYSKCTHGLYVRENGAGGFECYDDDMG